MNTHTDPLARELRERAAAVQPHPLGLDQVKHTARRLQRRRRVATGMVTAAVLAVAVPVGLTATGTLTTTPAPQPADTPSTALSRAATPNRPATIALGDLPRGDAPAVPYIVPGGSGAGRLVTPEGARQLPEPVESIAPHPSGWVAVSSGRTLVLDESFAVVDSAPAGGPTVALSDDGSQVAWTQRDAGGQITLYSAPVDGLDAMTWQLPGDDDVVPLGFLDGGRVLFTTYGEQPLNAIAENDGSVTELDGFLSLRDGSTVTGLVAGQTSYEPGRVCFGVMDPAVSTSELVWETCDHQLGGFSPDGRYLVGGTPEADAIGSPTLSILDAATGEPVVELAPPRDRMVGIAQTAWEDEDSVLALTYDAEAGGWAVLRASTDGTLEQATELQPGSDMDLPLWFAAEPRR